MCQDERSSQTKTCGFPPSLFLLTQSSFGGRYTKHFIVVAWWRLTSPLIVQQLVNETSKLRIYWPFVKKIHRPSVDSSHKWISNAQSFYDVCMICVAYTTLQWRHNERDGVLNHQPHDCLLNRLFKAQIKENIKALRHWPLCGEFTGDRWTPRTKGQ